MKLSVDTQGLREAIKALSTVHSGIPKAYMRALNHTGAKVRTAASREITSRYTIKAAEVKKQLKDRKATSMSLLWELKAAGRPRSLVNYKLTPLIHPLPRGKTIKARVLKKGSLKPLPGHFYAQMGNGHFGVFKRSPGARWSTSKSGRKGAYPIVARYGPGVSQMMASEGVSDTLSRKASEWMQQRFDHETKRVLSGIKVR